MQTKQIQVRTLHVTNLQNIFRGSAEVGWQEGLEPPRLSKRRGLAPPCFGTIRQVLGKEQ